MSNVFKYSFEERLEAVKLYKKYGNSQEVSRRTGISSSLIKFWVRQCDEKGIVSLIPDGKNQEYSPEIKISIVEELTKKELTLSEASLAFDVPRKTINNWCNKVKEGGYCALFDPIKKEYLLTGMSGKKKKEEPLTELEQLREENMRLRAELDLIKKVDALVAQRCKPTRKSVRKPSRD